MKVVLVIPPSPFLIDDRAFPFLGPLQIAAVARQLGHEVHVADLTGYKARHPDVEHADPETVHLEAERALCALLQLVAAAIAQAPLDRQAAINRDAWFARRRRG